MVEKSRSFFKPVLYVFFILFLLADTLINVRTFYDTPLDGDMAESIVPSASVEKVMKDPLGIKTIIEKDYHHNPNRFFSHWIYQKFFRITPAFLQTFLEPVKSVYAACALAKILMQIALIYLIYVAVTGSFKIFNKNFILASVLTVPLFQNGGYGGYIGIIDYAVTYTFFYAMPAIFLIIYFLPLILEFFHKKEIKLWLPLKLLWIPFGIVVCFSGPLNTGVALIVSAMMILKKLWDNFSQIKHGNILHRIGKMIKMIPGNYYFYLIPVCLLSFYSLYVGTFNSAQFWEVMPLKERFIRLLEGIKIYFTDSNWFLLMGSVFLINMFIISQKYKNTDSGKKILCAFKWITIFSVIYIFSLPFGGYRSYRPNIIRFDTILPVSLSLIFLFTISTFFVIKKLPEEFKKWYYPIIAVFLIFFTIKDKPYAHNSCEKNSLYVIAASDKDIVPLETGCSVSSWGLVSNPEDTRNIGKMLYIWKVTDSVKLYYNVQAAE